jgi:hypothetical protein
LPLTIILFSNGLGLVDAGQMFRNIADVCHRLGPIGNEKRLIADVGVSTVALLIHDIDDRSGPILAALHPRFVARDVFRTASGIQPFGFLPDERGIGARFGDGSHLLSGSQCQTARQPNHRLTGLFYHKSKYDSCHSDKDQWDSRHFAVIIEENKFES